MALVHVDFGETESLVKVFQHQVLFEIKKTWKRHELNTLDVQNWITWMP